MCRIPILLINARLDEIEEGRKNHRTMKQKPTARQKREAEKRRRKDAFSPARPSVPKESPVKEPVPKPNPAKPEVFPDRTPEEDTANSLHTWIGTASRPIRTMRQRREGERRFHLLREQFPASTLKTECLLSRMLSDGCIWGSRK